MATQYSPDGRNSWATTEHRSPNLFLLALLIAFVGWLWHVFVGRHQRAKLASGPTLLVGVKMLPNDEAQFMCPACGAETMMHSSTPDIVEELIRDESVAECRHCGAQLQIASYG